MCVRINNIHTVINIFTALEEHLYSCTRTAMPKPISAFGYVSSDPGELSPRPMTGKSLASNPHHNLPENETTSEGPASVRDARRGMLTLLEKYFLLRFTVGFRVNCSIIGCTPAYPTLWPSCVCMSCIIVLTYSS